MVMAFGAGALVSALSLELTVEAYDVGGGRAVVVGLLAGSAAFFVGDLVIDHAFTGLRAFRARVTAADGHGAELRWDGVAPWVQVHTGDRPEPEYDRAGLAVEPMTCPPDAFNSGTDLVVLSPGEHHTLTWAIAAV